MFHDLCLQLVSGCINFFYMVCFDLLLDYDLLRLVFVDNAAKIRHVILWLLSSLRQTSSHVSWLSSTWLLRWQILPRPSDWSIQLYGVVDQLPLGLHTRLAPTCTHLQTLSTIGTPRVSDHLLRTGLVFWHLLHEHLQFVPDMVEQVFELLFCDCSFSTMF